MFTTLMTDDQRSIKREKGGESWFLQQLHSLQERQKDNTTTIRHFDA